ncbi:hypothetical protein [Compostimonas suwonensis]|uniref:Uncharacterized protein n=1 Tax=Compostimonas suwonensis TaxID=1048394 RepID=A0A2M9BCU7_9MICO|nr:hypothetical protein [Compostimonas suwonensis]PJJ55769.1 hypothetical protein CLV54_3121 [Compostimonas suwonensis]
MTDNTPDPFTAASAAPAGGTPASAASTGHAPTGQTPTGRIPTGRIPTGTAPTGTASVTAPQPRRYPARIGTIIWGMLLLAFAAYMIITTVVPPVADPVTLITGALIAGGLALVIVGIAAASRRP